MSKAIPLLTDEPIDHQEIIDRVLRDSDGAVVFFAGVVRDHHEGRAVESILYEAYRPMAETEMETIVDAVRAEIEGVEIALVHRLGHLRVGETSIAIACSSSHRAEAFEACRQIIERVKRTVPIWKKEKGPHGEEWVGWQGD